MNTILFGQAKLLVGLPKTISDQRWYMVLLLVLVFGTAAVAETPLAAVKTAKASGEYQLFKQQCETINRQFKWRFQKPEGTKNLNLTNKKSFEAAVPQKMIEQLVAAKRQQESALKSAFGIEINTQQLQTELRRMAKESLQPERLKQLFSAFGNDADLIAECIARPYLVEKSLKNKFSYDTNIHQAVKRVASEELKQFHKGNKSLLKGHIHHVLFTQQTEKSKAKSDAESLLQEAKSLNTNLSKQASLTSDEWHELRQQVTQVNKNTNSQNINQLLLETEDIFYGMQLMSQSNDVMEIEFISWPKLTMQQWLNERHDKASAYTPQLSQSLQLPDLNQRERQGISQTDSQKSAQPPEKGSALDPGYWRIMAPGAHRHKAVWTGTEMLIWGGTSDLAGLPYWLYFPSFMGTRYDPITDQWSTMSHTNGPAPRTYSQVLWTGTELLVWGGQDLVSRAMNNGARYNPLTDTWTAISEVNAPMNLEETSVWTGTEMIIWGGHTILEPRTDEAAAYNPSTDTWRNISAAGAPVGRSAHSAFWTGTEMIIWGGDTDYLDGGRYDPVTDSWTTMPKTLEHARRFRSQAIATSKGMMVFGGGYYGDLVFEIYDYEADEWLDVAPAPDHIYEGLTAVSLGGDKVMVWGPKYSVFETLGAIYDVETDTWTDISDVNKPTYRKDFSMVWTGEEVVLWGGQGNVEYQYGVNTSEVPAVMTDGSRYNPSTDQWVPMTTPGPERTKIFSSSIWTGSEMIIWGGYKPENWFVTGDLYSNEGHRFNPVTSTWLPISLDVPLSPRYYANSIWNGDEMLIWGGNNGTTYFNDGARYDPLTDSWQEMSQTSSPIAGFSAFMAWMDNELLVITHDGGGPTTPEVLSGAMYNPVTDLWRPMNVAGAPTRFSDRNKARWNGSELYVGGFLNEDFPHGAVFYPDLNQWFPLNRTANHEPKYGPATGMIGNEFIVAGGQGYHSGGASTSGEIYNTETGVWRPMSETDAFGTTSAYLSVWTGEDLILWGERYNIQTYQGDGGKYNFATDTWVKIWPHYAMRFLRDNSFTTVWADNVMLIWGGEWVNFQQTSQTMANNISAYYPVSYFQAYFTARGLQSGTEVNLSDDKGNSYLISANGAHSLVGQYAFKDRINVTIVQVSSGTTGNPLQDCYLVGLPGDAGINSAFRELVCEDRPFEVSGTVSGLMPGNRLILEINSDSADLLITQDGNFTFSPGVPDQATFEAEIKHLPNNPYQTCHITQNTGTINAAPASGVTVVCEPSTDLIFESGFESTGESL